MLSTNNIYSFDENSIVHQCSLKIPAAFRVWFSGKKELNSKNYPQLMQLIAQLKLKGIKRYKFIPSDFSRHVREDIEDRLAGTGDSLIHTKLFLTLKSLFVTQFENFIKTINTDFEDIKKDDDYLIIKELFIENPKELHRKENIPEDDDFKILRGLEKHLCNGEKYLVSLDEHFWGYSELIERKLNIKTVKEWECNTLY